MSLLETEQQRHQTRTLCQLRSGDLPNVYQTILNLGLPPTKRRILRQIDQLTCRCRRLPAAFTVVKHQHQERRYEVALFELLLIDHLLPQKPLIDLRACSHPSVIRALKLE